MANIVEENLVVKVSQLVKDSGTAAPKFTPEIVEALEQVVSELVGGGCVVEVMKDE
jgi:hypothetical protein